MTQDDSKKNASDRATKAAAGAGFEFAASVAAFAIIGFFVDRWLGTTPTWTLVGTAVGFVGGGYNLYRATAGMMKSSQRSAERGEPSTPRGEDFVSKGSGSGAHHSGDEHEHVPAFEPARRKSVGDCGMFGRDLPEEDEMVREEDVRWPDDARADDTPRPEDEGEERR